MQRCRLQSSEQVPFLLNHHQFTYSILGIQFPLPDEDIQTIKEGIAKYGVLIFRNTGLDNVSVVSHK